MPDKDAITKVYMQNNVTFADAFNFLMFDGKQVIQPEALHPLDTTSIANPFGGGESKLVQKYRDVLKYVTAKRDDKVAYWVLGIENQSEIHNAMPVRNMLYDAIQYSHQVSEISQRHRQGKEKPEDSADFLSGFYKTDRLLPTVTLVIYFGAEKWNAPRSLHEMFGEGNEEILAYVPDYRINLIEPAAIADSDFDKFHTDLREALLYIKYSKNKAGMEKLLRENEAYSHLKRGTADMINAVTGSNLQFQERKGEVNMCEAVEAIRTDARYEGKQEGILEGKQEGIVEGKREGQRERANSIAKKLLSDGTLPADKIADFTGLTLAELQALMET